MKLRVRLFAALRERAGRDEIELEGLPAELDVAALVVRIAAAHPELGDLALASCVVDERYARPEERLGPASRVALLPPVSGGRGRSLEEGVFELSSEPLEPALCEQRVAHPACGAIVCFTGTTRERNRERSVTRLDYEAFPEMAGPEMERIFAECLARHGPSEGEVPEPSPGRLRMLCVHRVGRVEVGEPSVVIAVASPHRAGAFEAARFLIDELKRRLPVWKKEVYQDGAHWIGDRS